MSGQSPPPIGGNALAAEQARLARFFQTINKHRKLPYRRPHAEQVFNAVVGDGGLTEKQAALLNELYALEGRLEHASPDVDAEEVRDAVERLRKALPELVESVHAWLARRGVEL